MQLFTKVIEMATTSNFGVGGNPSSVSEISYVRLVSMNGGYEVRSSVGAPPPDTSTFDCRIHCSTVGPVLIV